jgi:hypothetical protein
MFRTNKQAMLLRSLTVGAVVCALTVLSVVSARAIFKSYGEPTPTQNTATGSSTHVSSAQDKVRPKSLKERALERDVEVESTAESDTAAANLPALTSGSSAIVVGKIKDAKSFFDESGHPLLEYGDIITTEYNIEVLRVLKNTTLERMPPAGILGPAPVTTPLKIARNGGVVQVNGHKAAVKLKGYEQLVPGREYVFFLNWSPDYKAYVLSYGISGAVAVDEKKSLRPLADNEELRSSFGKLNLDTLAAEINR